MTTAKTEAATKVLVRDPVDVCESHRREGWKTAYYDIQQVFAKEDEVRVVMRDGRSGRVVWDTDQTP